MRFLLILTVLITAPREVGGEVIHLVNGGEVDTGKNVLDLPAGYYLPEADWDSLDAEVKRLQDSVTKLTAENASFREQAAEQTSHSGVIGVASAFVVGLALGLYVAW